MDLAARAFKATINWSALRRPVEEEIERTLSRARRLNRLNNVTGAILLFPAHIVQWIEGEPAGVADTFECASRDERVKEIEVIGDGAISHRLFQASWMFYSDCRTQGLVDMPDFLRREGDDGERPEFSVIFEAMRRVASGLDGAYITRAALMI